MPNLLSKTLILTSTYRRLLLVAAGYEPTVIRSFLMEPSPEANPDLLLACWLVRIPADAKWLWWLCSTVRRLV